MWHLRSKTDFGLFFSTMSVRDGRTCELMTRKGIQPSRDTQCSDDVIAPIAVGEYTHRQMPNSELVVLKATGHCPNLSAPDEVISAMRNFV
jgi:pimeloyl-ACP methyl ester carboxylesterase